jgi:hypothetical protein
MGFGDGATHTRGRSHKSNLPVHEIEFPLSHPVFALSNGVVDAIYASNMMGDPPAEESFGNRVIDKGRTLVRRLVKRWELRRT